MEATWKDVVGYEGIYEVSNFGQIRRIAPWTDGRKNRVRGERRLNPKKYMRITLYRDKTKKEFPVHRLVYLAFIGEIPLGYEINHKNGKKHDNRVENLEAVSHSQNQLHSYAVLKRHRHQGSKHPMSKLNEDVVREARLLYASGMKVGQLAKRYGVSSPTMSEVLSGKLWAHVA